MEQSYILPICTVNTMPADALTTQGAKASTGIMLT